MAKPTVKRFETEYMKGKPLLNGSGFKKRNCLYEKKTAV
jgi:hypothetical protein